MKRRTSIITCLVCLAALTGCRHDHIPDNLIDTATMTAILTEYFLIDSYDYVVASRYPDSLGFHSKAAKDSMLSRYNVTQADIDSSLAYYVRHQKAMEQMLDRAMTTFDNRDRTTPAGNPTQTQPLTGDTVKRSVKALPLSKKK
ncbi:MAG: DUF4296 domain-containing protein [Bacteroidales bacterium]|nr:DUF4296 domain-containing protein [Bacteroidales bacterium]